MRARLQVDVFSLTLPNIGELKRIVIGHDNSGVGADWHLNMVCCLRATLPAPACYQLRAAVWAFRTVAMPIRIVGVVCKEACSICAQVEVLCVNTGQHCRFYYNGWLSKDEAPYKLEVSSTKRCL